jgi:hypothetical protein
MIFDLLWFFDPMNGTCTMADDALTLNAIHHILNMLSCYLASVSSTL